MGILQKYQANLDSKRDLSNDEAVEVFNALRTATDQEVIRSFLSAWSEKGVTSEELSECAKILRKNAIHVETKHKGFIDIVGTGGSRSKIFNVSTAAAFVVAGAGLPVAKHGNRAASSKTGSADALSKLGVNIIANTDLAEKCLNDIGICFMFAPKFHNLTKELALARKSLGHPTIFNVLGPMANPAGAPFQLIGVWKKDLIEPIAKAIAILGTEKTWIVHGEDGLDEITLNGKSYVAEIVRDEISYFEISPEDFGLERNNLSSFNRVTPEESAKIIKDVVGGQGAFTASIDIVIINAAAALYIAGAAGHFKQAIKLARQSIESGTASAKLEMLMEETNR